MASAYAASSLLICRSGSSTLAEISTVGRAAILIPLPTATDHHQEKNAETLVQAQAAFILHQTHNTGQQLAEKIRHLYYHPQEITELAQNIRQFSRPDAAKNLVQTFLKS
jgi:UDP-N-acetylglucosamine--N-acetylmuramyl-(pentapeptide) pyrophosphoryl-undecaprenol N-acetylglucosamine transferase